MPHGPKYLDPCLIFFMQSIDVWTKSHRSKWKVTLAKTGPRILTAANDKISYWLMKGETDRVWEKWEGSYGCLRPVAGANSFCRTCSLDREEFSACN